MFHVCVGSSPSAFYSFLCPNGTLFNELYFTCDWWFNVDCHQDRTSVSDSITTSQSDSPAVRIDTIYSAIKAANEKYESQNYGGSRSVRHTLSSELRRRTKALSDLVEDPNSSVLGDPAAVAVLRAPTTEPGPSRPTRQLFKCPVEGCPIKRMTEAAITVHFENAHE